MSGDSFDHYWNLGKKPGPWVGFDEKDEEECPMTFGEFHNALRIMRCIDFHEVEEFMASEDYVDFKRNPANYFLKADDEKAAMLWAVIEARQHKRAA